MYLSLQKYYRLNDFQHGGLTDLLTEPLLEVLWDLKSSYFAELKLDQYAIFVFLEVLLRTMVVRVNY